MTKTTPDLYLLADGTHAKPGDCEKDADGVLRHIYGMPVALDADGKPMTVARGAVENKNVEAAKLDEEPAAAPEAPEAKAVEAEPAAPYKNRQAKSK